MIKSLKLKFGKVPGLYAETILTTPVTVFVGPNNSGKSRVLIEINRFCTNGNRSQADVILDNLDFVPSAPEVADGRVKRVTLTPSPGESVNPQNVIVGKKGHRMQVVREQLLHSLLDPNSQPTQFCQWYLGYNTLILDGRNRINLINEQGAGDLQQPAQTSFQVLFKDDVRRLEVRRIILDAFGYYFVLDPTHLGHLRIRLASRAPTVDTEERGINDAAVKFHSAALPIDQTSDGVKAFTGIVTEIIAGDPSILLIDEPEAFLHPSLAFKLGKEISLATIQSEKRLFVSTHSPDFVMGCIQSGAPVNIVRLTYRGGVATARLLSNPDILKLMRNPLLRSTGVLSGLFYEFVIVTESDADRAFYQEVNERLLRYKQELGIPNCLFINAQNKQTVQTIIRPLRELGIPAVGVVDVDILKDGGTAWTNFLNSGFVPAVEHQALGQLRSALKAKCEASGKDMKRDGGINILSPSDKEAADNLFDQLEAYGLFVVRSGELESWLKHLGVGGHSPSWLVEIFQKMGDDPESVEYLKPTDGDVWSFIGEIKKWLTSSNRKGIPV